MRDRPSHRRSWLTLGLTLLLLMGVISGAAARPADSEVRTWPAPGTVVEGASATLVRQPLGVSFSFHAADLEPEAFTLWFGAFNQPQHCESPVMDGDELVALCGLTDLLHNAAAEPSALWSAGHVAGESGRTTFGGRVAVGDTSGCDTLPCNDGLTNLFGAEIHLTLRTHGPPIAGMVEEQIHSFNGGCKAAGGPNDCDQVQFAVFEPVTP